MSILYLAQHYTSLLILLRGDPSRYGHGLLETDNPEETLLWTHFVLLLIFLGILSYRLTLVIKDRPDLLKEIKAFGARADEVFGSFTIGFWGFLTLYQISAQNTTMFWVWLKIILVMVSYVLARIAIARLNKRLAVVSLAGFGLYFTMLISPMFIKRNYAQEQSQNPKLQINSGVIYNNECNSCHGPIGETYDLNESNLSYLSLDTVQTVAVILNGRNEMPGYRDRLTNAQAKALASYIMEFRDPLRNNH